MKYINNKKNLKTAIAIAISTILTSSAKAQMLEEVVVTAQKRAQSIQDVPIAITAFGADDLERLNANDMADMQFSTPNLTISYNGKTIPRIGMRGISDYSRNPGYDNRVSVYVDGIYAGRSAASNQSTLDIERVEVLRGPQGTLFGKNTVAGAISLTSKKPSADLHGSVGFDVGKDDYLSVTGTLNTPVIEDKLYAKLMVSDKQRDGYKTNLFNGDDLDGLDEQAARLQLRWLLDNGEVNFSADKTRDITEGVASESVNDMFAPKKFEINTNQELVQSMEGQGAGLTVDYTLANDFELTSISGYREMEFLYTNDEDYTHFDVAHSTTTEKSEHFSQELRLASPENDTYDYVLGLFYYEQTNDSSSSAIGGALFPNPNTFTTVPATVDVTSLAAYVHGNYRFNERWSLTGGLRYTYEEKELEYTITDTTGLFTNGSLDDERDAEDFSPKIGVNYFFNEDVMFYANYAKSFKSGGWNVDFISTFDNVSFDDEQVQAYELGVKSTLADGRVRLNMALYNSNYSDFQVFQFVPLSTGGTILTITNAGEVTSKGFEADINWAVSENFTLWATYGYSDSVFDEFKDGGGPGVDYDGNDTVDAPSSSYSVGLQYVQPLGSVGELVASVDYSFRDEFYTNPNNLEANVVGDYDLVNARIGIESSEGDWSVFLWGKNLADADDVNDQSVSFLGVQRASYIQPRSYGLTFKYNFGSL